jgi:Short C-terminal domain
MKNSFVWLAAVVALFCLGGSGCSRSERSKDLAALDQAYKAGVLNKEEYEAKKSALESQSEALKALDNSLATGAISQADYQTMKARTIAKASALTSLERARRAGVLSQEEYLAKKAALLANDTNSAPTLAADSETTPPASMNVASHSTAAATSSNRLQLVAEGGLKSIHVSGGGEIIYGHVEGQTSEAGAMGTVLHSLHKQLGDRPQVGKLFQVRGTQSVAAFFSVNMRNQGGGQIAGLIIAAKATSDHVEVAVVSDDAARFPATLSPMMKTLFSVWHPLAVAPSAASPSSSNTPAQLRQITLQDGSASVGLPEGWNIVPNMSSMGTIVASGPKGESAELDITFLAYDTNNRMVQQTMQALRNGRLGNTAYARATYYPYGGDLSKAFVYMIQNVRRKAGLPEASYNFSSVTPVPGAAQERCVHMTGTADMGDGKGLKELNGIYCARPPGRAGGWLSMAYTMMAPVQVAAGERATLGAILQSFNVNMSVVNAQSARISGPAIEHIHAIGRAAANQAAAAHERNDIQNSSVYQRWDNNDKRSQEFENYQLGYSVISDTGNNVHGTLWNEDAAALVQNNPDKYEYVSAPNYWKGIDY